MYFLLWSFFKCNIICTFWNHLKFFFIWFCISSVTPVLSCWSSAVSTTLDRMMPTPPSPSQRCPHPTPLSQWVRSLTWQNDVDAVLGTLGCRLPGWIQSNHTNPSKVVNLCSCSQWYNKKTWPVLVTLKMEEGNYNWSERSSLWKPQGQGNGFPPASRKELQYLGFGLVRPTVDFSLQDYGRIYLCCFKPQSLWQYSEHQERSTTVNLISKYSPLNYHTQGLDRTFQSEI